MRPRHSLAALTLAPLALAGCADGESRASPPPAEASTPTATSAAASVLPAPTLERLPPCDAGLGSPKPRDGCPDADPEIGWLSRAEDGQLQLQPFRSLTNDAEGRTYAVEHGLEYPYPGDIFDVAVGTPVPVELASTTRCTGVILVQYRSPLRDHVVRCAQVVEAGEGRRHPIPVVVWREAGRAFQVSELYRP